MYLLHIDKDSLSCRVTSNHHDKVEWRSTEHEDYDTNNSIEGGWYGTKSYLNSYLSLLLPGLWLKEGAISTLMFGVYDVR